MNTRRTIAIVVANSSVALRLERFALRAAALVWLAGLVAACGGGGGSAPAAVPPPVDPPILTCETPPEGIQPVATFAAAVGGTIVGRTDPLFILLQAPDTVGRIYDRLLIYGPDWPESPVIAGEIYAGGGGVSCNSNDRTAVNGADSGIGDMVYLRTEIGDSGAGATLLDGGSLRLRTTPIVTYALEPGPLPGIVPNYAISPAQLVNAVGSWTLYDRFGASTFLDVAADGAFTVRDQGCSLRGNLRVHDGGLYTVTAEFEPTSCTSSPFHPFRFDGLALVYPLATGGWQMVFAMSTDNGIDPYQLVAIGRR